MIFKKSGPSNHNETLDIDKKTYFETFGCKKCLLCVKQENFKHIRKKNSTNN